MRKPWNNKHTKHHSKHRDKSPKARRKAQVQHTWNRAVKRYGVMLNEQVNDELCRIIEAGNSCVGFIERQDKGKSAWLVQVEGIWLPVIYEKFSKVIVTVLPMYFLQGKRVTFGRNLFEMERKNK